MKLFQSKAEINPVVWISIHYITRPAHSKQQWPPALASTGGGSSDARDAADWALWHCHRFALHRAALDIGLILEQCFIHGLSRL